MQFVAEQIGKITHVKITGRIDAVSADSMHAFLWNLLERKQVYLVIDCSEVIFLSSAGMRAFLTSRTEIEKRGGKIVFSGFRAKIDEVIRLTGLSGHFIRYPSLEEAIHALLELIQDTPAPSA